MQSRKQNLKCYFDSNRYSNAEDVVNKDASCKMHLLSACVDIRNIHMLVIYSNFDGESPHLIDVIMSGPQHCRTQIILHEF